MTPIQFLQILAQNPKVSQQCLDDAMQQNGWKQIPASRDIFFTDGKNLYFYKMPDAAPRRRAVGA